MVVLLLVTGCSNGVAPSPASLEDTAPVDRSTSTAGEGSKCSNESSANVSASDGFVVADRDTVDTKVGEGVLVAVDTDVSVQLRAGGSDVDQVDLTPGVSALCITYPSAGIFAVVVDDRVVLQIRVEEAA
jgi:hypothetical protein